MAEFASYAGARVASANLVMPIYGRWSADVLIALDDQVPDTATLIIGTLSLIGTVRRQALYGGSRRLRLIGGFDGWQKSVPSQQYSLSSGVKASLLLADAAKLVGERVNVPNDRVLGDTYTRADGPASALLAAIAGASWYIDRVGVTQVAAWPTRATASPFVVVDQRGDEGRVTIATEDYGDWLPGTTFTSPFTEGTLTAKAIELAMHDDGIARLEVLT